MALAAVLALVIGLGKWNIPEYAITPGDATPVAPLVKVQGVETLRHHDKIMLTDVYLQSLTAWQWLTMHFQSHVQFVSANELLDPGVPSGELTAQGYLEMSDAKQAAEVSAFHTIGWKVPSTDTGAILDSVEAPSPAYVAGLHVADEIVGADGTVVDSSCSMISALHSISPGTVVTLEVKRAKISASGVITWRAPTRVKVTTVTPPSGSVPSGCPGVTGVSRSWLGVSVEDGVHYALPARVSIDTSGIGGPSAGLAMTLTLIDELSRTSITGGKTVAATGTMDAYGNVGDVGGVAQKTVAVQRAGAKYFIVPEVEVATAKAAAQPGLSVFGVTTLAQALRDLRSIGGGAPVALTTPH